MLEGGRVQIDACKWSNNIVTQLAQGWLPVKNEVSFVGGLCEVKIFEEKARGVKGCVIVIEDCYSLWVCRMT